MLRADVVFAEAELEVRRASPGASTMRCERRAPFGCAGRAARVEHDVRVVLVDRDGDVVGLGSAARAARRGRDADRGSRAGACASIDSNSRRDEERRPPRACPTTRATSPAVKRAFTGTTIAPSFSDGEVDDRILDAVGRHDGDAIAAADAEPRERARELVRARVERRRTSRDRRRSRTPSCSPRTVRVAAEDVAEDEHYLSSIRISR